MKEGHIWPVVIYDLYAYRCYRMILFAYLSLTVFTEGAVALRELIDPKITHEYEVEPAVTEIYSDNRITLLSTEYSWKPIFLKMTIPDGALPKLSGEPPYVG